MNYVIKHGEYLLNFLKYVLLKTNLKIYVCLNLNSVYYQSLERLLSIFMQFNNLLKTFVWHRVIHRKPLNVYLNSAEGH